MSFCNVAILGENVNLEKILPRLAQEGGFDCVSAIEFRTLKEVFSGDWRLLFHGAWKLHLIAPDMPFHQHTENELFRKYINDYLEMKAIRVLTNPTENEMAQFIAHEMQVKILITKCHF